jgi:predicted acyltransferase (DUF342 family)
MFLNQRRPGLRKRIKDLTSGENSQAGVALIAAIGVMAVLMIVIMTVSAASVSASEFASATRAGVQSRAAADAGIDAVRAKLMDGKFVCALPRGTNPTFDVTVAYSDSSNSSMTCSNGSVAGTPKTARITSTGEAGSAAMAALVSPVYTVIGATVDISMAAGNGAILTKAVFSEGDMTLTNQTSLLASGAHPGSLYSNGSVTCLTTATVQGGIIAQKDFSVGNDCTIEGSVWTGGNVALGQSAASVTGNIFSAGGVSGGKAYVGGSVVANNSVTFENGSNVKCGATNSNVCGSVYSLRDSITLGNAAAISGSAYARGAISSGTGNIRKDSVSLSGGSPFLPLTTSANPAFVAPTSLFSVPSPPNLGTKTAVPVTVKAPPREGMPQIPSTDLAAKWDGWTIIPATTLCNSAGSFGTELTKITKNYPASSAKLLIRIDGCSGPVALNNDKIVLTNDVALMSPRGFSSGNMLTLESDTVRQLSWIVPSDSAGVTWAAADPAYPGQLTPSCTTSSAPNITVGNLAQPKKVEWFIYTPCAATLEFTHKFVSGQIYAGKVSIPTGATFTRSDMTVPGAVVPGAAGTGAVSTTVTSRYDVNG